VRENINAFESETNELFSGDVQETDVNPPKTFP
jgi:hypothetical protein